jgi:hypothetical protein
MGIPSITIQTFSLCHLLQHRQKYSTCVGIDGPQEPDNYVLFGEGEGMPEKSIVTLSVAKRPGANAVHVVDTILEKVASLKGSLIPEDMKYADHRKFT